MNWNDTVTLLILGDTILNAKLLVGGYFLWRWWRRRSLGEIVIRDTDIVQRIDGNGIGATTTGKDVDIKWTR